MEMATSYLVSLICGIRNREFTPDLTEDMKTPSAAVWKAGFGAVCTARMRETQRLQPVWWNGNSEKCSGQVPDAMGFVIAVLS
jgi:hypothetical protein